MGCWGDLSNSILRPEILHGTLYMPKEWENEAWCLIFNKTIFLTHPNLYVHDTMMIERILHILWATITQCFMAAKVRGGAKCSYIFMGVANCEVTKYFPHIIL